MAESGFGMYAQYREQQEKNTLKFFDKIFEYFVKYTIFEKLDVSVSMKPPTWNFASS